MVYSSLLLLYCCHFGNFTMWTDVDQTVLYDSRKLATHPSSVKISVQNNILNTDILRIECRYLVPSSSSSSSLISIDEDNNKTVTVEYLSDSLMPPTLHYHQERKKGVAWTEEEHRKFLMGLEKLGKGDWRRISRNIVTTRTPTQVASHAQKYFLRQDALALNNSNKKKTRSSLFDMAAHHQSAGNNNPMLPLGSMD